MSREVKIVPKYGMRRIRNIARMDGALAVLVGVLKGTGAHPNADKGQTIAEIAWWNEFGTRRADGSVGVPERPFLRWTLRDNDFYREHILGALLSALRGEANYKFALKAVGQTAASDIRNMITNGNFEPNAPSTIAKKSTTSGTKDKPLIDLGILRQSIQSELVGTGA